MTGPVAGLPMYDWPEIRQATDELWTALRHALAEEGVAAPAGLDRTLPPEALWRHPGLVLAQTCGLPYSRSLATRVTLLGAADHRIPDTSPGFYRSAIVVHAEDARESIEAFRGALPALNGRDSQSGYAALLWHVAPHAEGGRFFAPPLVTGSHAASAAAVAAGLAALASIDYVAWRLFERHRPEAARLRVLELTDPAPALPYIAAAGSDARPLRAALSSGLAALGPAERDALGVYGFTALDPGDYAVIGHRLRRAEALMVL